MLPMGYLSERAGLCRGEQLLLTFFGEGSRQLKLNRASPAKQVAESAGRPFLTSCSSACRSTCKLRDLKSPAPIPDPSVFCACPVSNGTGLGFLFWKSRAENRTTVR